jgi:hypothetical protein
MISTRSPRIAMAIALLATATCKVDRNAVYDHVYACDPKAVDPGCGTDRDQQAMMCFAGRTLGGTDFCAQQCPAGAGAGVVCSGSGALLATCDLSPGAAGGCGDEALGCFRNNVLANGGVCMSITPCTNDSDCRDPVRSTCATSFVKKIYQTPSAFKNDHLWCLQSGCQAQRTACSPGESCLRDLVPAASHPPDICVPNCDSNLHCPPAHLCYRKVSGPAAPAICVPGLLGFSCDADIDCMMGQCVPIDGLKVCTTTCGNDADCAMYDGEQGKFICNETKHCVAPESFTGAICDTDADCTGGLSCAYLSSDSAHGSCLTPCGADGACTAQGGIPKTCIPRADGKGNVCFPGYFGLPCSDDSGCLPGLSCRSLGMGQPSICTNLCADDGDCAKNRWTAAGYCQELADMSIKVCLSPRGAGEACDRDTQCESGRCLGRSDGSKACAPATGGSP